VESHREVIRDILHGSLIRCEVNKMGKVTVVKEGKAGAWNAHIRYYFTNQELRKQLDGCAYD
jgi:hypothetical protein